ncbi:hypothetical protein MRX96_001111 [Rhipicephalus microplus]
MSHLRRSRGIVRATTTRIIMSATEALQAVNPSLADLQVMNDLQDKDATLDDFNERIADLIINDTECDEEKMAALQYHDKICNIMSRFGLLLDFCPGELGDPVSFYKLLRDETKKRLDRLHSGYHVALLATKEDKLVMLFALPLGRLSIQVRGQLRDSAQAGVGAWCRANGVPCCFARSPGA